MLTLHEIYSNRAYIDKSITEKHSSHLNKRFSSIGRAKRFQIKDESFPGPGNYYTDKSDKKGCLFGKSEKELRLGASESPGPGRYNLPIIHKPCYSFARKIRERYSDVPGPGDYTLPVGNSKGVIFGSEPRKDNFINKELTENPEPWRYQIQTRETGPKWRFGSDSRAKEVDISKLSVFDAIALVKKK